MPLVEDLTGPEVARIGADKAIVVFGSFEAHGPQVPLASDTIVPFYVAKRVMEKLEPCLLLPPVAYGNSLRYDDHPFTVTLMPDTVKAVAKDIFKSLIKNGITKIMPVSIHDGNMAPLRMAMLEVKQEYADVVFAAQIDVYGIVTEFEKKYPGVFGGVTEGCGHAGAIETSFHLWINPELVHLEEATDKVLDLPPSFIEISYTMKEVTPDGAYGEPSFASAKAGKQFLDSWVDTLVAEYKKLIDNDWKYGLLLSE